VTIHSDIAQAVKEAVAEALALEEDEVTSDAAITADLGAESIDLLDVLFRIERATGVKLEAADLADYIQGGIPDEIFGDDDGKVSETGLAQLKRVMPQIDEPALAGELEAERVIDLFTVSNLVELVSQRGAVASA
jgi:acyl carrier protein